MGRGGLTARAAVVTERDGAGRTRLAGLRSDGPLALRPSGDAVYLVGAAAGPLGGDVLELELTAGGGSRLVVRQSAATLVLPGAGWSRTVVRARVEAGGTLLYEPEPVIVAGGCRHRAEARIDVAEGGTLRWREQLVLGRSGERPEEVVSRLDVTHAGVPALRHELRLGLSTVDTSSAVLGTARAVGGTVVVAPGLVADPVAEDGPDGTLGVFSLAAGSAVLVTATAADTVALRRLLERGEQSIAFRAPPRCGT